MLGLESGFHGRCQERYDCYNGLLSFECLRMLANMPPFGVLQYMHAWT